MEDHAHQHALEGKRLYNQHNKYSQALTEFHQAFKIYQASNPQSLDVAHCAKYIGMILGQQGKLDESLHYLQISLNIYKTLDPDSLNVAASFSNIGNVLLIQDKLQEALHNYNQALAIQQQHAPNSLSVAGSLNNIGAVLHDQGKLQKALHNHNQALAIKQHHAPNSLGVAGSLNNIGIVLKNQGKLQEALHNHNQALAIKQQHAPNSLDVASSFGNIGNVLANQGKLQEALHNHNQALAIQQQHAPNSLDVAISQLNIARVLQEQQDFDSAFSYLTTSYAILTKEEYKSSFTKDHIHVINCKYELGNVALAQKKWADAITHADYILQHSPKYKFAYLLKAKALMETDELDDAKQVCQDGIKIAPNYADIHLVLVKIGVKVRDKADEELREYTRRALEVDPAQDSLEDLLSELETGVDKNVARALKDALPSQEFTDKESFRKAIGEVLEKNFRNAVSGLPNFSQYESDATKYAPSSSESLLCVIAADMANLHSLNKAIGQEPADGVLRHYGNEMAAKMESRIAEAKDLIGFGRVYHRSGDEYCAMIIPSSSISSKQQQDMNKLEEFLLSLVVDLAKTTCPLKSGKVETYLRVGCLVSSCVPMDDMYNHADKLEKEVGSDIKSGFGPDERYFPLGGKKNWKIQWDVDGMVREIGVITSLMSSAALSSVEQNEMNNEVDNTNQGNTILGRLDKVAIGIGLKSDYDELKSLSDKLIFLEEQVYGEKQQGTIVARLKNLEGIIHCVGSGQDNNEGNRILGCIGKVCMCNWYTSRTQE